MTDHFFFHASLAVWFAAHGHAFPAVSHVWRFEPDALFAGGLDALMAWSRAHSADVVLPRIKTQAETPKYPPFTRDPQLLAHVPASQRVWSYFVVGRYSRRFLGLMERKWADGQIGFEEVFLPTSCANHSSAEWPCVLHGLGRGLHANGDPRADAAIVGAARGTGRVDRLVCPRRAPRLWHPSSSARASPTTSMARRSSSRRAGGRTCALAAAAQTAAALAAAAAMAAVAAAGRSEGSTRVCLSKS